MEFIDILDEILSMQQEKSGMQKLVVHDNYINRARAMLVCTKKMRIDMHFSDKYFFLETKREMLENLN